MAQGGSSHAAALLRGRRGFALIVALVLMGFMLLMMLSLGFVVNVDMAGGAQSGKRREAEQNALLGLHVALGQLQQLMGPDQRVSARADILATDGNTASLKQPHWTGVWELQESADEPEPTLRLLNFLVSGNETGLKEDARNATLAESESVKMAETIASADPDGTDAPAVWVKKVELGDGTTRTGAYGYWISDEGIKAKVNLKGGGAAPAELVNFPLLAPQQAGIAQMDGMAWFNKNDSRLDFVAGMGALSLLKGAQTKAHLHDITFHSYGVLSNTKAGGLKKDLTAGLASGSTQPAGQMFAPVGGTASAADPGGPLWQQLRSWANTPLGTAAGGARGTLPVRKATDQQAGYAPLVAGWELYTLPVFDPANDEIYMCFMPVVVLWNPYDVPLESAAYKVRFFFSTLDTNQSSGFIYRPTAATTERRILQLDIRLTNDTTTYRANVGETEFEIPAVSIAPGQSKVFSMTSNLDITPAATVAGFDHSPYQTIQLEEALPSGHFYRLPLRDTNRVRAVLPSSGQPGDGDFKYVGAFPRAVAMELIRIGGVSGNDEILSAGFLLKHGHNTTPFAEVPMESDSYSATSPLATSKRAHALGMKASRKWTKLPDRTGTHNASHAGRWLADYNPRGTHAGAVPFWYANGGLGLVDNYTATHGSFFMTIESGDANQEQELDGLGYSADGTLAETILFEAPYGVEHLFSIGQLMHAPLYNFGDADQVSDEGNLLGTTEFYKNRLKNASFDNLIPAYAIGNSRAHVAIQPESTYRDWSELVRTGDPLRYFDMQGMLYDYSYLLNDALWDGYFFSTLKAQPVAEGEPASYKPLNLRIVAAPGVTEFATGFETAAGGLMVDGAFNINSTSKEAWRALLASHFGQTVALSSGGSGDEGESVPLPRMTAPAAAALDTSESESTDASANVLSYTGYRRLGAEQIDALAEEMVRQVRLRGPFTSLSQFVNRSLLASDATHERHLHGALGKAIDNTNINDALRQGTAAAVRAKPASVDADKWFGTQTGSGHTTEGVPGWLTQADVLAKLGSVITARSDTFVIRAYGEAANASGSLSEPAARAWCEAVVQRLPEFVDTVAGQEPHTGSSALNDLNKQLGRRFVVVSFRWLSSEDL